MMAPSVRAETPMKPIPEEWRLGKTALTAFLEELRVHLEQENDKILSQSLPMSIKEKVLEKKSKHLSGVRASLRDLTRFEQELNGRLLVIDLNE
jgi:hypothetical protein